MKKVISFLMSVLMSVLFFISVLVPVSATSTETETTTEPLLTSFSGVPIEVKSYLYTDSGLKYKYFFIYRYKNGRYVVYFIHDISDDKNVDNISYLNFGSSSTVFCTSDNVSTSQVYRILQFDADGKYLLSSSGSSSSIVGYNNFYGYSTATDKIQNAVDNIIYSDFPVKYNDLTVYQTSKNKSVVIEDIINLSGGDGSGEIVGPQPLPSDNKLYGTYLQKNEETLKAFTAWLISTEKYKDLAKYGLSISADNLYSMVDCWWDNKFSPTLFLDLIKNNGVNTISSASSIIGWFSASWSEYISINNAVVEIEYDENANANMHHRATDVTDDITETDENGNIIVVQEKDTEDLLVLREILRQIINLPANIAKSTYGYFYSLNSNIADNVYSICLSITDLPSSIANAVYNNFLVPLNSILEKIDNVVAAINNIDFSSSNNNITNNNINVDIDLNNDTDYNISLGDIEMTLNNKFAFYSQLTEVQNVFESAEFEETPPNFEFSSVTLSDGTALPSFSFDFSLFDKYRTMIHSIIIAVAYLNFFINLLHRLPDVIGGI